MISSKFYLCALPNSKQVITEVWKYQDDRINRYLESLREGELLQSIYRIRPLQTNGRSRIRILLLTAQQIDGLYVEVFSVKTWHQIAKQQTIQKIVNSAKNLLSRQPQFCIDDVIPLTGLSPSTVYRYAKEMQKTMNLKDTLIVTPMTCKDGRIQSYGVRYYSY